MMLSRLAPLALGLVALAPVSLAQTVVINQNLTSFDPPLVSIPLGSTVRWVWSGGSHTVTEGTDGTLDGNEAFHSSLNSTTPIFEVTFDQAFLSAHPPTIPGRYDYFCIPHFVIGMSGVILIEQPLGTVFGSCDGSGAAPPCGNAGAPGVGCRNSTGAGSELSASGSASASADDLVLAVSQLPANQPALLFAGTLALAGGQGLPFGDGLRAAGGSVVRLGVKSGGAAGMASWGPGLSSLGGWGVGDTRHFQVWYRDPAGSPCGSGFNLSNGLTLDFTN